MGYRPIENYGVIGDLRTTALVGLDGSIDFMCFPHFDSPTLFAALLDDTRGGRFSIAPAAGDVRTKQMYLPDTTVLLTRFLSADGIGEVTDFMPVNEPHHAHRVVRRVRTTRGAITFRLRCAPRFNYARTPHRAELQDGAVLFTPDDPGLPPVRLRASVPMEIEAGEASAEFTLRSGEGADFVLEIVRDGSPAAEAGYVDAALRRTLAFWRDWVGRSSYAGRWREMVMRSALTLKLLTSQTCGSAAAATFGLPETIGGGRNWDYRFTWIRDASLTAAALTQLGFKEEATAYLRWVRDRYAEAEADGRLQIMYGIDGRHELIEETLPHLEGYRRSAPVRIYNGAYKQLQIDIYGELMLAVDAYDQHCEPVTHDFWADITHSINWTCANWERRDEGIWEVRGGQQEFLYSRLMSWTAIDRALRVAERRSLPAPVQHWRETRDTIYREIFRSFWDPEQEVFVQHKGARTLDAACLLMPIVGLIAPRDPRWLVTLKAIGEQLTDDSLVYRYRVGVAAADGLVGDEGTFNMCSFWYIQCLALAGELEKAQVFFEKIHGFANHLGLYAEELGLRGEHLGNFPQAFTHLGLITAALTLDRALSETS